MINASEKIKSMIQAPARQIRARAELYNSSALVQIFSYTDALKEFNIERVGDASKFFGFGVVHRLSLKLIDINRAINITTENTFEIAYGVDNEYIYTYPFFKVSEVHRDENTNELSITAYDVLHDASKHTVAELSLPTADISIKDYAVACANLLGVPLNAEGVQIPAFSLTYAHGANFEGTETVRDMLNAIAEATQTIYYINSAWELVFKRLDKDGDAVLTIDKEKYITLDSKTNRRLTALCSATELGDNVTADTGQNGTTQFVRDNPFWELREDIAELVENALAVVAGLTINQFNCSWRGNFLLEIGDKIELVTKDDNAVTAYVFDDAVSYNGYFTEQTQWSYTDNDGETASNPSTLGETLKQTYARVDKANKRIDLVASETAENRSSIAQLRIDTESATISIREEIAENNSSVVTETGYRFDADGMTISKSGSEMTTQITEDGMKVYRNNTEVLTADNMGVNATNLHATTYLIIGNNSRLEDYEGTRTACFWIGG